MRIVLGGTERQPIPRHRPLLAGSGWAIARQAGQHEVWLALSGRFPESIESLRAAFAELIPSEQIRVFELPGPIAEMEPRNAWRMQAAELS